jgi:hypothetical protein
MGLRQFLRRLFGKRTEVAETPTEPASPFAILSELPDTAADPSQEEIDAFQKPAPLPWTRI